jgi:phosphoadenosine phosphosulfate reductase
LSAASAALEAATPAEILQWTVDRFHSGFAVATAFGAEGMLIIHWLAQIAPHTPIFNLDTGYQFPETLEMVERVRRRYGIEVELVRPELNVPQYEQLHRGPVHTHSPDQCCRDRKLVPLRQRLRGVTAWASAIRRDQSPDRAVVPIVGWDRKFGLVKVSPLANWSKQQVWRTILAENVPYNPLHDHGYPSIGCQPCTRCVFSGEDERSGRWAGSQKTECGLHSQD